MRRVLLGAASVYVLVAVIGRLAETIGAVTCGCAPDCWCKTRGLSLFRWVFPAGHRAGLGCT